MKPIIGIVEWPYDDIDGDKIYEVPNEIVEKVSSAGGIPIGIFPTQICKFQDTKLADIPPLSKIEKSDIISAINMCDAIIKPGTLKVYEFDKFIHDYTVVRDMPYLGICGGMQLMTYPSGKLKSTHPNEPVCNLDMHKSKEKYAHSVNIKINSKLYDILKTDRILVNSQHRYRIVDSNDCFVSAIADDGTIEAIEIKGKSFQIGVQWHPEKLNDQNSEMLFNNLIEEANVYKLKRK